MSGIYFSKDPATIAGPKLSHRGELFNFSEYGTASGKLPILPGKVRSPELGLYPDLNDEGLQDLAEETLLLALYRRRAAALKTMPPTVTDLRYKIERSLWRRFLVWLGFKDTKIRLKRIPGDQVGLDQWSPTSPRQQVQRIQIHDRK